MIDKTEQKTLVLAPVPEIIYDALKQYAKKSQISLYRAHEDAINWFITFKESQTDIIFYLAPPTDSAYRPLWIDSETRDAAQRHATHDKNTINRLIFTAIVYFMKDKGQL